ncbi:hypothetical protein H5410_036525 [Solanum commersonii]|uniref:Uncharacterized protein n=1 Tax=Solanum commersonii TaxID=4109 RepID=A0A9J5Y528_SOLCO|nr:hypothetical protein H5410_036525 [Solanum commersonii]
MKEQKINISSMPRILMQIVHLVKIIDILNGSLLIVKYKFNAKISSIDSNTNSWYPACKKCYRYRLKIDVIVEE